MSTLTELGGALPDDVHGLGLQHIQRAELNNKLKIPGMGEFTGIKSMIMLEVEGAGDYLPSYSGNLDIMTAAAKATGELLAARRMAQ